MGCICKIYCLTTGCHGHIVYIIYVIYIPWLQGVYGEYTTLAPRYQPEAKPRADIEGRGLYI